MDSCALLLTSGAWVVPVSSLRPVWAASVLSPQRKGRFGGGREKTHGSKKTARRDTRSVPSFPAFTQRKYYAKENYNTKREDLEEEDQGEDERNVIL